jgi:hypothetical protein
MAWVTYSYGSVRTLAVTGVTLFACVSRWQRGESGTDDIPREGDAQKIEPRRFFYQSSASLHLLRVFRGGIKRTLARVSAESCVSVVEGAVCVS